MQPRHGKATRRAPEAGATVPEASARSARGARTDPNESPAAPEAALPEAGKFGPARKSGSRQKKSPPDTQERSPVRATGARAKKVPQRAQDARPSDATSAAGAEGLEPPAAGEPALSRAGSCSQRGRGARCSPKPRPPPGPWDGPSPGLPVSAPILVPPYDAAPGARKLRAVLEKLRLSRLALSSASKVVNGVVGHLLHRLKCESGFGGVERLHTGSYYEHVKISAPNEFDVMFKLEVPRIQLEEYSNTGAYYFVKFKRNPKENPLSQFLEDEILSASKMLSKFRKIIKEEINNIKDTDVIMKRKRPGSPAVTLLINKEISVDITLALESKTSWPTSTREGLSVKNWLSAKVRQQLRLKPFYLVPKHAKEGNGFQEETWRLSFSHIEKEILSNHGKSKTCCENKEMKCCRKDCLKLMKYLLEQLKEKFKDKKHLEKFSSYHVKTAFFHICTHNPQDSQWDPKDLGLCFDNCVTYFLECLRTEKLPNYFIPGFNLFSSDLIEKKSKDFLSKQIEYERNNEFPVFGEF
ncbi:PREDICTED: cyclic GMP-AMP synthase [Colobus angolensis palliatus]|uniref:Cyclic GMP-AMP synthase n=1 Tax=Colobus angolensis palliatus TaxID=336983 RepID=A0A2K5JA57_COLAP|nr:PREDICTED: cyclic GMP-AMP synthase [Colobus angolensis palliatus]